MGYEEPELVDFGGQKFGPKPQGAGGYDHTKLIAGLITPHAAGRTLLFELGEDTTEALKTFDPDRDTLFQRDIRKAKKLWHEKALPHERGAKNVVKLPLDPPVVKDPEPPLPPVPPVNDVPAPVNASIPLADIRLVDSCPSLNTVDASQE